MTSLKALEIMRQLKKLSSRMYIAEEKDVRKNAPKVRECFRNTRDLLM